MFISDRILSLLAERPSMSKLALRAALPDCKGGAISHALTRLRDRGLVEPAGWLSYRLMAGEEARNAPDAEHSAAGAKTAPKTRAHPRAV